MGVSAVGLYSYVEHALPYPAGGVHVVRHLVPLRHELEGRVAQPSNRVEVCEKSKECCFVDTRTVGDRTCAHADRDAVGRDWLAAAVARLLSPDGAAAGETKSGPQSRFIIVYGESGTGKSSFMCRVLDGSFCKSRRGNWQHLHERVLVRHICQDQSAETLNPPKWAQSLAGQLMKQACDAGKELDALQVGQHTRPLELSARPHTRSSKSAAVVTFSKQTFLSS